MILVDFKLFINVITMFNKVIKARLIMDCFEKGGDLSRGDYMR